MTQQENYDAVIVGGGIAGLMTANRMGQLGKRAVVLEQGSEELYPCNTRFSGGTMHVALRNIMDDESTLKKAIIDASAGFITEKMAGLVAREGQRVVHWMKAEGTGFIKSDGDLHHGWVLAPPVSTNPGLDWKGRGGDVLLRTLERNLLKRGGLLTRGTRARSLIMENGECRGVVAQAGEREVSYRASAVVLADGGFQGNLDLVKKYISPHPERLRQRGAGNSRGDCLQMASAVGALIIGTDCFYGHLLSRDAMTNDKLWPHPYLDNLATAGIMVGPTGERFVDEGRGGTYMANMLARLQDPLSTIAIFDHAIWEGPGRTRIVPINPFLQRVGGTLHIADDLGALAVKLGMEPARLIKTVQSYNDALASGKLAELDPPRRTTRVQPRPIASAPFYAAPACAGITHTMGGIAINEHAQALAEGGAVIKGLYVAGAAAGGLEGGPQIGYVGGLVRSGVTGLVAAEHIAGQPAAH